MLLGTKTQNCSDIKILRQQPHNNINTNLQQFTQK